MAPEEFFVRVVVIRPRMNVNCGSSARLVTAATIEALVPIDWGLAEWEQVTIGGRSV